MCGSPVGYQLIIVYNTVITAGFADAVVVLVIIKAGVLRHTVKNIILHGDAVAIGIIAVSNLLNCFAFIADDFFGDIAIGIIANGHHKLEVVQIGEGGRNLGYPATGIGINSGIIIFLVFFIRIGFLCQIPCCIVLINIQFIRTFFPGNIAVCIIGINSSYLFRRIFCQCIIFSRQKQMLRHFLHLAIFVVHIVVLSDKIQYAFHIIAALRQEIGIIISRLFFQNCFCNLLYLLLRNLRLRFCRQCCRSQHTCCQTACEHSAHCLFSPLHKNLSFYISAQIFGITAKYLKSIIPLFAHFVKIYQGMFPNCNPLICDKALQTN